MKQLLFVFIIFFIGCQTKQNKTNVFIDTDCGTDDLIAIELLLNNKDINIVGISCVDGLTDNRDGARIVRRFLNYHNYNNIPVFFGFSDTSDKINKFPIEWKNQTTLLEYNLLKGYKENNISDFNPSEIINILNKNKSVLLTLGPLTNIEHLIKFDSLHILENTKSIIMGGAIFTKGNLSGNGEYLINNDKSEWNFYSNCIAASSTLDYIKNIVLVPLDATKSVKIDSVYLDESKWVYRKNNLTYLILKNVDNWIREGQYYAWDPLAAAYLINEEVLTLDSSFIKVITNFEECGRTIITKSGNKIYYAKKANKELFDNIIFSQTVPNKKYSAFGR